MLIDNDFTFEKKLKKAKKRGLIIGLLLLIIQLILIGLIVYVIAHFLGKIW